MDNSTNHSVSDSHVETLMLVNWKFEELKNFLIFSSFFMASLLMKIFYYRIPKVSEYILHSCVLVVTGFLFGIIIKYLLNEENQFYFKLTPELFSYTLLPVIILESSYSLYRHHLLDNLLPILVFAVIGTLFTFFIVGFSLYGFAQVSMMKSLQLSLLHCLLFSSIIIAVDPVASIAICKEVNINEDLHYLIFGECVLNNAIIVELYTLLQKLIFMNKIDAKTIVYGIITFLTSSLIEMIIGISFGVLNCLIICNMVQQENIFLKPILFIGMGYLAFLLAVLLGWPGFICIISCALIQSAYALTGFCDKTRCTLKRFTKMLASISEGVIYLFLGVEIIIGSHSWKISLIICSILTCLVARFIVTFLLSGLINYIQISIRNIHMKEKCVIYYCGFRGAVSFSLAVIIHPDIFENSGITKQTIITTTLVIILFTIIVQGITIKPLVNFLRISRSQETRKIGLFNELSEAVIGATNKGIEGIIGESGQYLTLMRIKHINKKYIRPFLRGNIQRSGNIIQMNEQINNILLTSISIGTRKKDFHKLPESYTNLLNTIRNPCPRKMSTAKKIEHGASKQLKSLVPYLYRAKSISYNDKEVWEVLQATSQYI